MPHGKHLSRSFKFGVNPKEIDDNDGYASYTPTVCSRDTSEAGSPALAHAYLCHDKAGDKAVQDWVDRERREGGVSLAERDHSVLAEQYGNNSQWPVGLRGTGWNPIESVFRAITHPFLHASKISTMPRHIEQSMSPSYTSKASPRPPYIEPLLSPPSYNFITDSATTSPTSLTPTSFPSGPASPMTTSFRSPRPFPRQYSSRPGSGPSQATSAVVKNTPGRMIFKSRSGPVSPGYNSSAMREAYGTASTREEERHFHVGARGEDVLWHTIS